MVTCKVERTSLRKGGHRTTHHFPIGKPLVSDNSDNLDDRRGEIDLIDREANLGTSGFGGDCTLGLNAEALEALAPDSSFRGCCRVLVSAGVVGHGQRLDVDVWVCTRICGWRIKLCLILLDPGPCIFMISVSDCYLGDQR